jgi:hypothetical protein
MEKYINNMKEEYIIRKTAKKEGLQRGGWVCFNKSIHKFKQFFGKTPQEALKKFNNLINKR